jgi:Helix-turn-helix domain
MVNKHSVFDDGDPRKYYAAIPNIICRIGLNPYEIALYVYLKTVAGEDGICWKSTATIAKELKMGAGTVSRIKTSLARLREALGGKALILISTEMQNGGNPNHAITITDIWPENMTELARVRVGKATRSTEEPRVPQGNGRVPQAKATRSTGEPKNNPRRKPHEEGSEHDFISELRADDFYSHIDFDSELEKMQRWLARTENKGRKLTERFVIRWLDKIDRPVKIEERQLQPPTTGRAQREAELAKKMGWDKLEQRTA